MLLRSAWEETSLSAPHGAGTIDEWATERSEPIPLETLLDYADWFRGRYVADHDLSDVTRVDTVEGGYLVRTDAGAETVADFVVLAVGVTPFAHAPAPFAQLVGAGVGFATEQRDFDRFAGRDVVVVGAGQAGLESAGLAARAGANVEVLVRSRVHWFADREPHHERSALGRRLYRLAYPAVGYGPPPLNRLVLHPDLFAALPRGLRARLTRRLLRPGGSPWVRNLLDGRVRITESAAAVGVERTNGTLRLTLADGGERVADDVLLATGYRFALDRLDFLSPALRDRIAVERHWPVLDRCFESTAPGLFLVGYAAEGRFGPLSRFVLGTAFTGPRLRRGVLRRSAAGRNGARSPSSTPS
jgi:lysine/ornithine N-monooxygenase